MREVFWMFPGDVIFLILVKLYEAKPLLRMNGFFLTRRAERDSHYGPLLFGDIASKLLVSNLKCHS